MDQSAALQNRRILIVEDDFLVAQGLAALLVEAGATVVGPIGWAEEALAFVETEADTLDGVVLDVNLHGEKSYSIADALTRRHVRFVFVTGYGAEALDAAYRDYPRCEKPFDAHLLVRSLAAA
ncbi:DNA-binding NarL/FixJ family response regulator [Paraburkholderia sp. WC7.3g]|uniref:response regulator n=1 Tax=Paraburkholderia sp. WC7.3g TaxID=2991070 RepID=UPI003D190229